MKLRKKTKVVVALILTILALCCLLFYVLDIPDIYVNMSNKKLLRKYGWEEIIDGGKETDGGKATLTDFTFEGIFKAKVTASEAIGLHPTEYIGKEIYLTTYSYTLGYSVLGSNLYARIWRGNNKIICAYICNNNENLPIHFWSISTPYSEIQADIYADYENENH